MKRYSLLSDIQKDLKAGEISLDALVNDYLEKIEAGKHMNIFLEVFDADARAQAAEIQKKIDAGTHGSLAGLVIALKDNILYRGHKVSAASKILEGFESLYNSTVVDRLLEEDAIIIGRCNCDEFAMGGSNENSAYGDVLNPLDEAKVPGGSSGGSAAAVAAGMCHAALGSDTGGSIRQPASFCGVFGIKPTYGRVSRYGLIAYASSFDQIGPLTHSIEDGALIMEVISGKSEHDATSSSHDVDDYSDFFPKGRKHKIAYIKECIEHEGLDPDVKKGFDTLIAKLKADGHELSEVSFPYLQQVVPAYYVLTTAEASSNLSRFDGIHFGYRSKDAEGIENTFIHSRTEGFGEEVKRRIMLGTFVLSAGYYDAYYSKAQKVRRLIQDWTEDVLKDNDIILSPTTPHPAFKLGALSEDPIAMYLEDIFTVHANLAGNPAVSIPGLQAANGMPYGIQAVGRSFHERELFSFAKELDDLEL